MTYLMEGPPLKISLADFFEDLRTQADERELKLYEVLQIVRKKGYALIVLFLTIPFVQPIPIPISMPFGVLIALHGMALALNVPMKIPSKWAQIPISKRTLQVICHHASRVFRKIEKVIRPRLVFLTKNIIFRFINGLIICALGLFIALPIFIPGTNLIPGVILVLICLGILEDDGLLIALAYVLMLNSITLLVVLWEQVAKYL